ncbi:hypothetical protein H634G_10514 [Metarhizium anisopliae BRIP 53293]|uniref:TIM-barrel domain-containing protein n=1 Tax=Metarhizium anisopliae BRIP 53293 TaxID=1291518 RepID=A0A0D9NK81_METAN|nr:hypothetical protein H634G_10514 [Metarhizium anisopliae BRIP 53293]KJK88512.1 hypothetical protein H633G_07613 [Metarhizium anisopliae BRIP 53284]
MNRHEIIQRLRGQIEKKRPIVGAGAGIGLSAKGIEAGGGDLIVIYNSGRFRMAGRGSLAGLMPYSNANKTVVDMAAEVLSAVQHTPVLAGVCGTDPFVNMRRFLGQLQDMGFAGVQNFPTVGLIDGNFRLGLEETGMGYDREIGARTAKSLEACVAEIQEIRDAAVAIREDVIVLCHGGPIARPEDAQYILERVEGLHGFYGASSIERLPVEVAIQQVTREFKDVNLELAK